MRRHYSRSVAWTNLSIYPSFIHADSSRDPLGCSKEQLTHIFTHVQVMPSFLEHVFTLYMRDEPHLRAAFQSEEYSGSHGFVSGNVSDDGARIQHCFNLVGVEYEPKKGEPPFSHRQTAAYYTFDLVSGKSTWIILKANQAISQSVIDFTKAPNKPNQPSTLSNAFSVGLCSHLLLFEWVIQNWTPYINFLQEQYSNVLTKAAHLPVSAMTDDKEMMGRISRRSTMLTQGSDKSNSNTPVAKDPFTFDQLQGLHRSARRIQNGLTALEQSQAVVGAIIQHFESLSTSEDFRQRLDFNSSAFRSFLRKSTRYLRELESQRNRLGLVQAEVDRTISLVSKCSAVNLSLWWWETGKAWRRGAVEKGASRLTSAQYDGILQHLSMRIGESYAHLAKSSTDNMEDLTRQAKREAVSVHAITLLTLFFLPATFVAVRLGPLVRHRPATWILTGLQTFFGSGVVEFEKKASTDGLGYWTVRWGAVRLFAIVCGPLTLLVFSLWAVTYWFMSSRRRRSSLPTDA